ncbi:MAG: hypothetical protein E7559_05520 [Ruminococcaceae bacterium]|nr:hypothetical protein [Oscillospiraceae bacterium]
MDITGNNITTNGTAPEEIIFQGPLSSRSGALSRRYHALEMIGQGGNAQVYSAWYDDGTGDTRPNAIIKKLRPVVGGMITEDDAQGSVLIRPTNVRLHEGKADACELLDIRRTAFINEAREMRQFQQQAVCAGLLEIFEYRNTLCAAMQMYGGRTLHSEINDEDYRPDPTALLEDIQEVLRLVETLHLDGKLHMDISPDNIFRQQGGSIILLDFGSVMPIGKPLPYYSVKKGYSAPETERTNCFGCAADIYSIGAVLYRALFGRHYDWRDFDAAEFYEIDDLPINDGCKEQLRTILERSLAYTPDQRFDSADKFCKAIEEYMRRHNRSGISRARLLGKSAHNLQKKGIGLYDVNIVSLEPIGVPALVAENAIEWLSTANENIMLHGIGGKGKTTLLHMVWNRMLEHIENAGSGIEPPVPLYISLTGYPDRDDWRDGDDSESYIIRRLCVDLLGAPTLSACTPEQMNGLWEELSREENSDGQGTSAAPRYVLIADALDEVSAVSHARAVRELNRTAALPGVRVIVSTRRADLALDGFTPVTVPDIDDARIGRYMRTHGAHKSTLGQLRSNGELFSMLRRPLYLNLAGQMVENGQQEALLGITSDIELMDHYYRGFEHTKLTRVTAGLNITEQELVLLAYEQLVPVIAFHMEQHSRRYSISRSKLRKLLNSSLAEFDSADFLAVHYRYANAISHYVSLDAAGKTALGNRLLSLLTGTLCVMNEAGGGYEFINRHVGCYFAARHVVNRLALASSPESHREYALAVLYDLCSTRWRSEISRNSCLLAYADSKEKTTPLHTALELLRGERGDAARLSVRNIISSLLLGGKSLVGMKLDNLDLTGCDLVGMNCSGASFEGALLEDSVFMGLTRDLSAVIYAQEERTLFILSDDGGTLCVDTRTGHITPCTIATGMDLFIKGCCRDGQLALIGREAGRQSLALEVYRMEDMTAGAVVQPEIIVPLNTDCLLRGGILRGVMVDFSPDGRFAAVSRLSEAEDIENTVILIDTVSGAVSYSPFRAGCSRLRMRCDRSFYIIYDDFRTYLVRFGDALEPLGSERCFIEYDTCDVLCSRDKMSDSILVRRDGRLWVIHGDGRECLLNLPRSLENIGGDICEMFAVDDCCAVVIETPNEHSDFIALDNGTPAVNVSGRILSPISRDSALICLTEERDEYIGIYNHTLDSWEFRMRNARGMQEAAVNGRFILASRDNDVVVCDMETHSFRAFRAEGAESAGTHWWLSSDGQHVCSTRAGRQLSVVCYDTSNASGGVLQPVSCQTVTREQLGIERKVILSALSLSPDLSSLMVYCTCGSEKRFFRISAEDGTVTPLRLAETQLRVIAGQFLPDGRFALLGERDGRDLLQILRTDGGEPALLDVSFARTEGSKLNMVCSGDLIHLVTFGTEDENGAHHRGCAVVVTASCDAEGCFSQTAPRILHCSCSNNARVSCCHIAGDALLIKDRFIDREFRVLHLDSGAGARYYIDSLFVEGCSLAGAEGLSEEIAALLQLAGAR